MTLRRRLDPSLSQEDLLKNGFSGRQFAGTEPFTREISFFGQLLAPLTLLPADAVIVATHRHSYGAFIHAQCALGSILIEARGAWIGVRVSSGSIEQGDALIDDIRDRAPLDGANGHELRVWHDHGGQITWSKRRVELPTWSGVRCNYPTKVAGRLELLMGLTPPFACGRIIVFHGEPGTGKTSAVRALIKEWAPWCSAHLVPEPESFFTNTSLLDTVAHGRYQFQTGTALRHAARPEPDWRVLIAEDADDLLHSPAGEPSVALTHLFNMTDGIVGQDANAIYLITTNEPLERIHPALLRPGRCLARIEFGRFATGEARAWLPADLGSKVHSSTTLAEMYELRGDHERIQHQAEAYRISGYA